MVPHQNFRSKVTIPSWLVKISVCSDLLNPDGSPDPVALFLDELNKGVPLLEYIGRTPSGPSGPKAPSVTPVKTPSNPTLLSFIILCVRREYRRRGMARRMVEKSIRIARKLGCALVKCEAAVANSQRLFDQMQFITVKEIKYADWLREDGKQVFTYDDGSTCARLMLFKL